MWLQLRLASSWSHRNWGPWWHQDFQLEARDITSLSPCAQCMWDSLWLCPTHSLREAITRACGPPETSVAMSSWQPHTRTGYMKGNRHNYCWEEKTGRSDSDQRSRAALSLSASKTRTFEIPVSDSPNSIPRKPPDSFCFLFSPKYLLPSHNHTHGQARYNYNQWDGKLKRFMVGGVVLKGDLKPSN